MDEVHIDGGKGEGGGQVVRTALALSAVTGRPFRIERIRARRSKPGLMRQHLTAVRAAAALCGAHVEGDELGSQSLRFQPGPVVPGEHHFAVGTAGSTTLVLQTVLPPLLSAEAPSHLVLEGGTHNPLAPPFEFLARAFLPLLGRMGPKVEARLDRAGFYPAGGGRLEVAITPSPSLRPLELVERGPIQSRQARALVANLPRAIAERELRVVRERLGWPPESCVAQTVASNGPGNALLLEVACEAVTEVFVGFGEKGRPAEAVAERACAEAKAWLDSGIPVGPHLADQLLLPLALAGKGVFRTVEPTDHSRTNAEVIAQFLEVAIAFEDSGEGTWTVRVGGS